jgi:hypothetical protein
MASSRRSACPFIGFVFLLVAGGAYAADCTYRPDAFRAGGPTLWRRLSLNAELVAAPLADGGGRRRAVIPPQPKGDPFQANNFIDTEVFGKMVRDGVRWTALSSDEEFLRRVTIDLTGEIPSPEDVTAFLADTTPDKRAKVIDRLLASPAYADRWTMWFGDLVENVQTAPTTALGYPGRNAYYKYIHDAFASGKPYDQMVRELVSATGKSFTTGAVNYWVRDFQNNGPIQDTFDNESASTAARFLALPLQCLSCHNGLGHLEPVNSALAKRTRYDFWKNAAFFSQILATRARDQITGAQETTLSEDKTGAYRLNTNYGNKTARTPINGEATVAPAFFLGGETPRAGEPWREAYGRILTANPQFARATVNYLWKEMFGMGIVEPADSFDLLRQDPATLPAGAALQPTHPQLLAQLADAFVKSGYDVRALLRLMANSNAYQLSSRYTPGAWDVNWAPYYARHLPRRLMSEEMVDAFVKASGVPTSIAVNGLSPVTKAMQLPDTTEGLQWAAILNQFGRGNRDDLPRSVDSSIVQALSLLNDQNFVTRIRASNASSTVAKTLKATHDPGQVADALYLATLSRYPTAGERNVAIKYLQSGDLTKKTEDLQFALLNKLEFLFN